MKQFLKKLLLGTPSVDEKPYGNTIEKRIKNIQAIWNNDHHDDIGVEKLLRLFLATSQFFFPGMYIKQLFHRRGIAYQELAVDFFVIFKMSLPVLVLYFQLQHNFLCFAMIMWFILETILYITTLIFASDLFSRPRSYRRSMLLVFFNYLEIVFGFALIYARGQYLNHPLTHWFDPIYFSFSTSATIGYGDYYPITTLGKMLVSLQTIIFLAFVVLFLNFFTNKVEVKGYFDHENKH